MPIKEPVLRRLTIFAKGNLDLRDSLHAFRIGSEVLWNGINEIVRARFPGTLARLRHETWTRSDALLESAGEIPLELSRRKLRLGAFPLSAQFSQRLFEGDADVIALSVQPDLANSLVRHRRDGYLFCPSHSASWPAADKTWLRKEFEPVESLDSATTMSNLEQIIGRVRRRSAAPILVYNVSSVIPGESIHCHEGLGEILSTRIRRFNLGLAELSQRTGISVVDVDAIVARAGADRLKIDAFHLTAEGCRLVAEEAVRIIEELGCFLPVEVYRCTSV